MKTYIASDFHIGSEMANHSKIKEFLKIVKNDGDRLILVGDIIDLWRVSANTIINQEPFKSTYKELLATANVVPTHIVFGNHDYNLHNEIDLPNILVTDDFTEDNIYYCHGWKFDLNQRKYSKYYFWMVKLLPFIYQKYFKKPTEIANKEDRIYTTHKIYDEVNKFVIDNKLDYVVMGHTHNPIIKENILDCGDFVDSLSYIVIEDDEIRLCRLKH